MKHETTLELGDVVKDTITGFQGVVIARTDWLNGCVRLTIQPRKLESGKMVDSQTIDVEQLQLVKAKKIPRSSPGGGPMPGPVRR